MKNIHVLATDKPSRLFKAGIEFIFDISEVKYTERYKELHNYINHTQYITSDEEINKGDWFLEPINNSVLKLKDNADKLINSIFPTCKKIILTTDQDLINDGVQAIDDEFLQWFVKNPICEEVGVKHFGTCCGNQLIAQCINCKKYNPVYKIIIPKEESKQETFVNEKCFKCGRSQYSSRKPFCLDDFCNKDFYQKPKQETLEEALTAEEFFRNKIKENIEWEGEITLWKVPLNAELSMRWAKEYSDYVIKWQQERMYSEEDMRLAIKKARDISDGKDCFDAEDISGCTEVCTYSWRFNMSEDSIIEQFKKK